MTLVYLVAAWIAGALAASRVDSSVPFWLAVAAGSALACILLRASRRDRLALACLMLFAFGAARFEYAQRPLAETHVAGHIGRGWLVLTGTVDAPSDPRDTHVNLRVVTETVTQGGATEVVVGRVLVQALLAHEYHYGDQLRIEGALFTPPEYDDFSYRDYLARRGIHALLISDRVETVGRGGGQAWRSAIYALREKSVATVRRMLPSPQAPLLAGILLGDESGIPADVREAFNRTGAAHVIAISGANIAILLRVLMGVLEPLAGRRRATWLSIAIIFGYAVLVGGDPGVVRAALMGALVLFGTRAGRRAHGLTSLAFAVWLMSLQNPHVLWDIGFQLSVAATAGLVLFTDDLAALLTRGLRRLFHESMVTRLVRWLSEPLVVSIAAQIATTPLILLTFGRLSVAALFTNLLIVSIQPYIMILGWIALAAGLLIAPVGEALAWIVWLPLTYMLRVVESLARLSWASVELRLSASAAWVIYGALLAYGLSRVMHPDDRRALWQKAWRRLPATSAGAAGLVTALLLWTVALRQPDGRLHIWFLDVGNSGAALIETPRGVQILVDGGQSSTRLQVEIGRALPFYDRDLDAVLLTSGDPAAASALPALVDRYATRAVWLAISPDPADSVRHTALVDGIAAEAPPARLQPGHVLMIDDGVQIEVVAPYAADAAALRVTYGDVSFLLGYQLTARDQMALLEGGYYAQSTVLQLAGGGGERANVRRFLAEVRPQVAVAAVAAGEQSRLPHPTVLAWLEQSGQPRVYQTDRDGTLEFVTDGVELEVRTGR